MSFLKRLNNIYLIDAKMMGFDNYCSAYIVEGKEIALIDTGMCNQTEALLDGIKAHGFSIADISYIFVTHCEHYDHGGNVPMLLRENSKANVYINPVGFEYLVHPEIEIAKWNAQMPPDMVARLGRPQPTPASRIKFVNDGDTFDLGNGEKLKIFFAPGHQPSCFVLYEEKNKGLFINDLVGNYFADAMAHYPLNPPRSDNIQAIDSIKRLLNLPIQYLYLGHYGICDKPKEVMNQAINNMQRLLDIGSHYIAQGKPELIADKVYEMILPELEKLRAVRGEEIYKYATQEHIPSQAKLFARFCQERFEK